jgi:hypothetical protein
VIFYWLVLAMRKLVWLFKMPTARDIARIDPNSKCPACGAMSGKLKLTNVGGKVTDSGALVGGETMVQHSCDVCGGAWFEQTVMKLSPQLIKDSRAA